MSDANNMAFKLRALGVVQKSDAHQDICEKASTVIDKQAAEIERLTALIKPVASYGRRKELAGLVSACCTCPPENEGHCNHCEIAALLTQPCPDAVRMASAIVKHWSHDERHDAHYQEIKARWVKKARRILEQRQESSDD